MLCSRCGAPPYPGLLASVLTLPKLPLPSRRPTCRSCQRTAQRCISGGSCPLPLLATLGCKAAELLPLPRLLTVDALLASLLLMNVSTASASVPSGVLQG